ncbi:RNA recognition motif domain-containing protein [Pseudoalteromonas denitrificans]|uniref:RNA recognition motif. (A.k.a. RRM, RBD, or RNP domain) n=1 Tax=Pseudoalteromonas denitrificans DSM 6059 TaxID=1123010 RepID=A0A1I1U2D4_9GAMM|nr:RNA-binding protein [Pseudoalteromonas denitrificans]SFD63768.1 RNA recognition motif. (a.k.a. RRM, RBD, or RNP domain) [Pseudoalteromonas denitrificans DSM 6059]
MKSPNQKSIIFSVVLAIIGFVLAKFLLASFLTDPSITLAIGLLVGGIIISLISTSEDESKIETKTLYVGNLPYRANEGIVRELFEEHGKVFTVRLLKDKNTGKRRGFGFVEMAAKDADTAISALNDAEFQQRTLKVREAKQKQESSDSQLKPESRDQSV